jgi:hypothetical protein
MSEPGWLLGTFAGLMLAVSVYCFGRLVLAHPLGRALDYDVNVGHCAEGVVMAGMLSPGLQVLPNGLSEGLFAAFSLWFAARLVGFLRAHGLSGHTGPQRHGASHYFTHLVLACSMLYMYFAAAGTLRGPATTKTEMAMGPAPGTAAFVALPLFFVVVLCASAIWHVDALGRYAPRTVAAAVAVPVGAGPSVAGPTRGPAPVMAPRLESACHIAMCVAMAFMLVLML